MKLGLFVLPAVLAFSTAYAADAPSSNANGVPAACASDVQKYCSTAVDDAARQSCLNGHKNDVSDACKAAMGSDNGQQGQNGQPNGY